MSTSSNNNRPPFPDRQRPDPRRIETRRSTPPPLDNTPRVCRVCQAVPALPDDVACSTCGDRAIERARAGVDAWIGMDAERVRELERQELERVDNG